MLSCYCDTPHLEVGTRGGLDPQRGPHCTGAAVLGLAAQQPSSGAHAPPQAARGTRNHHQRV